MLNCPNCNERSISAWRKQYLSPLRKIRCPNCSALVSVGWLKSIIPGMIGGILPIAWLMVLLCFDSFLAANVFGILVIVALGVHHHFFIPLKVRAPPDYD